MFNIKTILKNLSALFLICFTLCLVGCEKETKHTHYIGDEEEEFYLNGKVKSVILRVYSPKENTKKIEKGAFHYLRLYKFDINGNIIEEAQRDLPSGGSDHSKRVYKYDHNGNKIEDIYYNRNGNLSSKVISKYDNNGYEIEAARYSSSGQLEWKLIYQYDNKGNKILQKSFKNDTLMDKWTFTYNKKGNLIESKRYNDEITINGIYSYKYDDRENLIEESWRSGYDGEVIYKYTFEYDKKNLNTELRSYDKKDNIIYTHNYTYDEQGNLIHTHIYNNETYQNSEKHYQYTYDKRKNWTKQISFEDGKAQTIFEREYTYYE